MQTISLTEALSVSERYQDVHLRLVISVGVHPTEKYSAIGTHFDSVKLGSLPYEAVDAIFFTGIADGVTEGWQQSSTLLPEDGSDVNFRVRDFSISIPLESLVEDELQALSGQLRSMTANAVLKLLAAPLSVEHE